MIPTARRGPILLRSRGAPHGPMRRLPLPSTQRPSIVPWNWMTKMKTTFSSIPAH